MFGDEDAAKATMVAALGREGGGSATTQASFRTDAARTAMLDWRFMLDPQQLATALVLSTSTVTELGRVFE